MYRNDPPGGPDANKMEPVIRIRGLNHYYGSGALRKQVLFDINLDIYPGEIVLLTGPSGSGKTTLLTLCGALRSIEEGSALVLGQEEVVPLCVLRARAIGVMTMSDDKGRDDKIIAVHVDDPEYEHYHDISELPPHRLKKLERIFLDYKALENKVVNVEDFRGRADAEETVREAARRYREQIKR